MKIIKRDFLKLILFLFGWFVLWLINRSLGNAILSFLPYLLLGILPYWAYKRNFNIKTLNPFFVWAGCMIAVEICAHFVPALWTLGLLILQTILYFPLIIAQQRQTSFSLKAYGTDWGKGLILLGVWYGVEMGLYPLIFKAVYQTPLRPITAFIMPLMYIAVVYGFAAWETRKSK